MTADVLKNRRYLNMMQTTDDNPDLRNDLVALLIAITATIMFIWITR